MNANKMAANIIEKTKNNNIKLSEDAERDITQAAKIFIAAIESQSGNEYTDKEAVSALTSIVNDWQWDGNYVAGAYFWSMALSVVQPLMREMLTLAVKLAFDTAKQKLT